MTNTNPEPNPLPPATAAPPWPDGVGDHQDLAVPDDVAGLLDLSDLIAAGYLDVVDGDPPVPITVLRVAGVDHPFHHDADGGLTAHTASLIVGSYARPGDTLICVGADPALAGAAGAGGVRYVGVEDPADLARLDHLAGQVRLVVLRWPPADQPAPWWTSPEPLRTLFAACRGLLARQGCIVVTLAVAPGESEDAYFGHGEPVIPAAQQGGLGWLQHIILITAPIVGERVTWRTTPADPATLRAADHIRIHLNLLVFVARKARHG